MAFRQDTLDLAAGTTHTNSTTEASIARKLFAVGDLQVGKKYQFECGIICGSAQSSDTATLAVRFGSSSTVTSNTAVATSAAVDVVTGDIGYVRGSIHVQSATRIVIMGEMAEVDLISTMTMKPFVYVFTSVANTAYYLDITADWSVAHADNQIASAGWSIDEIV